MEVKTTNQDGVAIVKITGNLDSNSASQAQEALTALLSANCCIVVDLEGCQYISSAGLRVLLMIAKQLPSQGGSWALAGVCEEVKDVMEMTGFSGFFKAYDTVDAAVEAIKK